PRPAPPASRRVAPLSRGGGGGSALLRARFGGERSPAALGRAREPGHLTECYFSDSPRIQLEFPMPSRRRDRRSVRARRRSGRERPAGRRPSASAGLGLDPPPAPWPSGPHRESTPTAAVPAQTPWE